MRHRDQIEVEDHESAGERVAAVVVQVEFEARRGSREWSAGCILVGPERQGSAEWARQGEGEATSVRTGAGNYDTAGRRDLQIPVRSRAEEGLSPADVVPGKTVDEDAGLRRSGRCRDERERPGDIAVDEDRGRHAAAGRRRGVAAHLDAVPVVDRAVRGGERSIVDVVFAIGHRDGGRRVDAVDGCRVGGGERGWLKQQLPVEAEIVGTRPARRPVLREGNGRIDAHFAPERRASLLAVLLEVRREAGDLAGAVVADRQDDEPPRQVVAAAAFTVECEAGRGALEGISRRRLIRSGAEDHALRSRKGQVPPRRIAHGDGDGILSARAHREGVRGRDERLGGSSADVVAGVALEPERGGGVRRRGRCKQEDRRQEGAEASAPDSPPGRNARRTAGLRVHVLVNLPCSRRRDPILARRRR